MSTTTRRETPSIIIPSEVVPAPTAVDRQFSMIQFDTVAPTTTQDSLDTFPSATTSPAPGATCSSDRDCASDRTCSKGTCMSSIEASPFGPLGGSSKDQTTHMSASTAIGVGLGAAGFILLLVGFGIWYWRRRGRKPVDESGEASFPKRSRSLSGASDQKTLVASLPNSPQNGRFREQHDPMADASLAKIVDSTIPGTEQSEKGNFAYERKESGDQMTRQRSLSNTKALPLPPNDMPLPPPPVEEKRYAINVNINKSMIFDDITFNTVSSARNSGASRDRMPKYRFEEYLPPVSKSPPLSISQKKASLPPTEYEMEPYPRKDSSTSTEVASMTEDERDEDEKKVTDTELRRNRTLKMLESKPPQIPLPDLPPPSPSFSFRSYDWYQDIIGSDQPGGDDPVSRSGTPSIPERNPARTPTKATFGAALSSNPPDMGVGLSPTSASPSVLVSPAGASHLHPSTAALPPPATLASPTSANFRLSPTVYTMPSRRPKAPPARASLQSTKTGNTHMSRSWLPEDGLYLPEEGSHDSYTVFTKKWSDDSRPTSYSPL